MEAQNTGGSINQTMLRGSLWAVAMRWFSTWFVLFSSKFIILGILDLVFGDEVLFGGIIPFFVVVFAILIAENLIARISLKLSGD